MITHARKHLRFITVAAAGIFSIALIAWNHEPVYHLGDNKFYQDTVPLQNSGNSKPRDLDAELKKLDRAIERLENLKSTDLDKVQEKVYDQLNRINIEEMTKDAGLAMKAIDLNKINIETQKALNVMDAEVMQKALKAIDVEVVQNQINEAMGAVKMNNDAIINNDAIQKAMTEVKIALDQELGELKDIKIDELKDINIEEIQDINIDQINDAMDAVKVEIQKAKSSLRAENHDFKKALENIKSDIQGAKKEIHGYQDMIYSMEKEGLLDTNKDYKIANFDGSIYINNKKQTAAVSAKYGKYLKNNITIRKEDGRLNIDSNQSRLD